MDKSNAYHTKPIFRPNYAFGETMAEQHTGAFENQYKFNDYGNFSFKKTKNEHTAQSAELDEETGFYYYGARYYNPQISAWLSVDPLADAPDNIGWSPYAYVWNNPIINIDPDVRHGETIIENEQGEQTFINDGYTFTMKLSNEQYGAVIASAEEHGGELAFAALGTDVSWGTYGKWAAGASLNGAAQGLADAADLMGETYGPVVGELIAVGIAAVLLKGPTKGASATRMINSIPKGKLGNHLFKGANKLKDTPCE